MVLHTTTVNVRKEQSNTLAHPGEVWAEIGNGRAPHAYRYQTHLLTLQQEDKISREMVEQLANEQLMKNYIEQKCAVQLPPETLPLRLYPTLDCSACTSAGTNTPLSVSSNKARDVNAHAEWS